MESGPIAAHWVAQPLSVAEHQFNSLVNSTRCDRGSDSLTVACLRSLNATDILKASPNCSGPSDMNWAPTVDSVELNELPHELLKKGLVHDVPTLFGTNADEGTVFVPTDISLQLNETDYVDALWSEFGAALGTEISHQYPVSRYAGREGASAAWWALAAVWGDLTMTCASQVTAKRITSSPGRKSGVWMYFFNHEMALLALLNKLIKPALLGLGCCHGSEIALVFGMDSLMTRAEQAMSSRVEQYVTPSPLVNVTLFLARRPTSHSRAYKALTLRPVVLQALTQHPHLACTCTQLSTRHAPPVGFANGHTPDTHCRAFRRSHSPCHVCNPTPTPRHTSGTGSPLLRVEPPVIAGRSGFPRPTQRSSGAFRETTPRLLRPAR
jgi:hypothetical protein